MKSTARLHATPLRYPGGKQKLTPFIGELLEANGLIGGDYAEPYAGGAGVACELLIREQVSRIHLNDADPGVFAFWHTLKHDAASLCRRIRRAEISVEQWRKQKTILRNPGKHDPARVGFAMLYLNRVNRSGILNGGLIGGLAQRGEWLMDARFNKDELIRRIERLAERAESIRVYDLDALDFIAGPAARLSARSLIYLDPPYYRKGSRLYRNYYRHADHEKVRDAIRESLAQKKWLVSYDTCEPIAALYPENHPITYDLQYSAAKAYLGKEYMAFSSSLTVPHTSSIPALAMALEKRQQSIFG